MYISNDTYFMIFDDLRESKAQGSLLFVFQLTLSDDGLLYALQASPQIPFQYSCWRLTYYLLGHHLSSKSLLDKPLCGHGGGWRATTATARSRGQGWQLSHLRKLDTSVLYMDFVDKYTQHLEWPPMFHATS